MRQTQTDSVIAGGILLFCGFATWQTLSIKVPPEQTVAGTSFVPWLMIGGLSVLALGLLARAVLKRVPDRRLELPGRTVLVRMVFFTLLMIAYGFAFMPIGYIPSTLIAFVGGLLLFGERRWSVLLLFPTAMTALIYFGFTQGLGVWLP